MTHKPLAVTFRRLYKKVIMGYPLNNNHEISLETFWLSVRVSPKKQALDNIAINMSINRALVHSMTLGNLNLILIERDKRGNNPIL